MVGITVVILFHVLLVYALVTGLAKKVVQVVVAPIETKVIEEVKKPPPPPEVVVPPPPKLEAPPPPFIPPPEVQITAPPPPQPTITATTPVAPPAPPAPAPKPAGPIAAGVACSKMQVPEMPAVNTDVQGSLFVIATVKGGRVTDVQIERNTLRGVADRRAMRSFISSVETAMKEGYVCAGDNVQIRQEFAFDIKN
ncbi:energy transducer TonB [Piscinibacter sakaiensis]|uniref:energy transducer TonB n=1 Tax=Piscinibacter sakaiensis TaxID=1547922 RepID=UPI00372950E9